jgi:hypothetical protein
MYNNTGVNMFKWTLYLLQITLVISLTSIIIRGQDSKENKLSRIIKEQQKKYVKASYGTYDYQCFTDKDLEVFKKNNIPEKIASSLKQDKSFRNVIIWLKKMESTKKEQIFNQALDTYKKTWEEMGKISREGQTNAGSEAEKSIAETIVRLAQEQEKLPEQDLLKKTK